MPTWDLDDAISIDVRRDFVLLDSLKEGKKRKMADVLLQVVEG